MCELRTVRRLDEPAALRHSPPLTIAVCLCCVVCLLSDGRRGRGQYRQIVARYGSRTHCWLPGCGTFSDSGSIATARARGPPCAGPVGLDKMLVDDLGDVTITNDGATILRQLEVEHPAGKVLVELSQLQDQEVGDGTTSVVVLAAEILKQANELIKHKIHPTSIIAGLQLAKKEVRQPPDRC
jgi:hypothetical protein